jgi:hypothetical protein
MHTSTPRKYGNRRLWTIFEAYGAGEHPTGQADNKNQNGGILLEGQQYSTK